MKKKYNTARNLISRLPKCLEIERFIVWELVFEVEFRLYNEFNHLQEWKLWDGRGGERGTTALNKESYL